MKQKNNNNDNNKILLNKGKLILFSLTSRKKK